MSETAPPLAGLGTRERARLLAALRSQRGDVHGLRPRGPAYVAPAAPGQRTLWSLEQLTPGATAYNLAHYYRIRGPMDTAALERAFRAVVARQQALRSCLREGEDGPVQIIVPELPVELPVIDDRGHPDGLGHALARARDELSVARIALDSPPLWRIALYRYADEEHLLVFVVHHVIYDGASEAVLCAELAEFYRAEVSRGTPRLAELPVQYSDFAHWQRERAAGALAAGVADFWRERLRGVGDLELPTDRPRPAQLSRRGHSVETPLPAEVAARVQAFARQRRTTTFLTYLAAFTTLLQQLSGQPDIVVGTATSGRERAQLQHLVGYFVTVISVRSRSYPGDTFETVVERAAREQLDALTHLDLPFEEVVKAVAPERADDRAPLFRVTFVVTEEPPAPQLIGAECDQVFHNHGIARFDMSWVVVEGQRPGVAVQYSTDLFDRSTIERFTARYARLVDWLVSHPAEPVAAAPTW